MATFNDGKMKEFCRRLVFSEVEANVRSSHVRTFTLPSDAMHLERRMYRKFKAELWGAETDPKILNQALEKSNDWKVPINLHLGTDAEVVRQLKGPFDLFWGDYCGFFKPSYVKTFGHMLKHGKFRITSRSKPVIAFTFTAAHDSLSRPIKEALPFYELRWYRNQLLSDRNALGRLVGIPAMFAKEASKHGCSINFSHIVKYRTLYSNGGRGTPMLMFVATLARGVKDFDPIHLPDVKVMEVDWLNGTGKVKQKQVVGYNSICSGDPCNFHL